MLALINTNTMVPPIAPIGLDYLATTVRNAGIGVDIVDLNLAIDPVQTLRDYFTTHAPQLVGLSFRNIDDCFWPSAQWFVPQLTDQINEIRKLTNAPIVLGGVGFSIFPERILGHTGADFGICGDGEQAMVSLFNELNSTKTFEHVDGLIWRDHARIHRNRPAWPMHLSLPVQRDAIDNLAYFQQGGQGGLETKRGCNRNCIYCADPLAKGTALRSRSPVEVADEAETLLAQGIDVLHLCDSEFNIPPQHAHAVCAEFNRRSLGKSLRWYTYMAVLPFDAPLAKAMRKAGCVGIDFTADSACSAMLETYRQTHRRQQIDAAVSLCRDQGIKAMLDLLLGGPGETLKTAAETINFAKYINPDAVGAALGIRIYPHTPLAHHLAREGPLEANSNIHPMYDGPIDLFKPTFYISAALGKQPAQLIRDLIAGDQRFFEPLSPPDPAASKAEPATDHNYNDNVKLVEAIKNGARGAYWDILRQLRQT